MIDKQENNRDIITEILVSLRDNELLNDPEYSQQAAYALMAKAAHITKDSGVFTCIAGEVLSKFFDDEGAYNR